MRRSRPATKAVMQTFIAKFGGADIIKAIDETK